MVTMAQNPRRSTRKKSDLHYWISVPALTLVAAVWLSQGITRPWVGMHEAWNGSFFSLIARNYLAHGLIGTRFGQVTNPLELVPKPFEYYSHHPPLLPLSVALFFSVFGESEWSARLVPILLSTASVPLVFLLGGELWGKRTGLIAAALFIINPMFLYYGRMVDHEPLVVFFMLASVFAYVRWVRGDRRFLWVLCAALFFGGMADWPAFYLIPVLTLHYLIFVEKKGRDALLPLGVAAASFALIFIHVLSLGHAAYQDLFASFTKRANEDPAAHPNLVINTSTLWNLLTTRARKLFPSPLIRIAALGPVAALLPRYGKQRLSGFFLLCGLFLVATIHVVLFQEGAYAHEYWIYYFLAPIALSAGLLLDFVGSFLPEWGALAPALVVVAILVTRIPPGLAAMHKNDNWNIPVFGSVATSMTKPGEVVLTTVSAEAFGPPYMFYYTKRPVVDRIGSLAEFKKALAAYRTATLMVTGRAMPEESLKQYLEAHYTRVERGDFIFYRIRR